MADQTKDAGDGFTETIINEGFLSKRSLKSGKSWQRRYFVLQGTSPCRPFRDNNSQHHQALCAPGQMPSTQCS